MISNYRNTEKYRIGGNNFMKLLIIRHSESEAEIPAQW